jgi:hypothetical protein
MQTSSGVTGKAFKEYVSEIKKEVQKCFKMTYLFQFCEIYDFSKSNKPLSCWST